MTLVVRGDLVAPRYLTTRDEPWIRQLIGEMDAFVGRPAAAVDAQLPTRARAIAVEHGVGPRAAKGVCRILGHFWRRRIDAARAPSAVRRVVFETASRMDSFDRAGALAQAADALDLSMAAVEQALYADLPAARVITAPEEEPSPAVVAESYNVHLVQGILGRAEVAKVVVRQHVRSVVRYAKLLRLLATFELGPDWTAMTISGPLSILRHTTKYGRAFASFLPCVLATPGWQLEAWCRLPKRLRFVATAADPIGGRFALPRDTDSSVERALVRDLRRLGTDWTLERETAAIRLDDGGVFFPDLTMRRGADSVLVEVVGYYTQRYLDAKLRALSAVRSRPIVVAIDESLSCDDASIPATAMVRYRKRIDPHALIAAVERAAGGGEQLTAVQPSCS